MDVLLLCTANQCRSPMAEVLLRRRLDDAGVTATVSSAGLRPAGQPATDHGIKVMADRGLDLSGHRSRQVDASLVRSADLVLAMAREHVREVAVLDPDALDRTFTLKELVRLASAHGPRRSGESLEDWLRRLRVDRRRDALVGVLPDDAYDVEDPVGLGRSAYTTTADELDRLLAQLVGLLWPSDVTHRTGPIATPHGQERSA